MHRFVTQHATGMCGVGKFLKIWGKEATDMCPMCAQPENARNIFHCPDPRAIEHWNTQLQSLREWMDTTNTDPAISTAILHSLLQWRHDQPQPDSPSMAIRRALFNQRHIGLRGLAEGLLAKDWACLQQEYYESIRSRRSGHRWASLLIQQLWQMWFSVWEFRNSIMHSPLSVQHREEERQADADVWTEYTEGNTNLPMDFVKLLRTPLAEQLKKGLPEKVRWTKLVRAARAIEHIRRADIRLQRRRFEAHFIPRQGTDVPALNGG